MQGGVSSKPLLGEQFCDVLVCLTFEKEIAVNSQRALKLKKKTLCSHSMST